MKAANIETRIKNLKQYDWSMELNCNELVIANVRKIEIRAKREYKSTSREQNIENEKELGKESWE